MAREKKDRVVLTVRLPIDLHQRLAGLAKQRKAYQSDLMEEAVVRYLALANGGRKGVALPAQLSPLKGHSFKIAPDLKERLREAQGRYRHGIQRLAWAALARYLDEEADTLQG